jgi:isopenicillin-N N-acyltransferase-like protein
MVMVGGPPTLRGNSFSALFSAMPISALRLLAFGIALLTFQANSHACTLWGASGSASSQGTLLIKNRDWQPDHQQSLRLVHNKTGMPYVGLFADDGSAPGIKAGVNQAGLSAVTASASSLPKALRHENTEHTSVLKRLLSTYRTLDEVAANADALFGVASPMFLLIADKQGLMQVEIGLQGKYAIERSQNATLAHTNHYLHENLVAQQKIGPSSATRLQRIGSLLKDAQSNGKALTLANFTQMSQDKNDGANNSLWRNGKEFTLASWQLALPSSGVPHLHLILANPGQAQQISDWDLDAKFWQQAPRILAGNGG